MLTKIGIYHGVDVVLDSSLQGDEVTLVVSSRAAARMKQHAAGLSADGRIDFNDPDWPDKIGRAIGQAAILRRLT